MKLTRGEQKKKEQRYSRKDACLLVDETEVLCYKIAFYVAQVYLYRSPSGAAGPAHGPHLHLNLNADLSAQIHHTKRLKISVAFLTLFQFSFIKYNAIAITVLYAGLVVQRPYIGSDDELAVINGISCEKLKCSHDTRR